MTELDENMEDYLAKLKKMEQSVKLSCFWANEAVEKAAEAEQSVKEAKDLLENIRASMVELREHYE